MIREQSPVLPRALPLSITLCRSLSQSQHPLVYRIQVGRHGTTQLAEFLGVFLKLRVAEPGPHLLSRGLVLKAAKRTVTSSAYCCATGGTVSAENAVRLERPLFAR